MNKKVTFITGTRRGIGQALAQHYVELGHQVIGCSRSEPSWSLKNYTHFVGDVADNHFVTQVMRYIKNKYGHLDNLINNAGIASMNHCLLTPSQTIQRIHDTNVLGTFQCCREGAKLMRQQKYGRIINFTSIAVPLQIEGEAVYAASKSAVQTLTKILARELAEFSITVNSIGPTPIKTDLIKKVPDKAINRIINRQAIKRLGQFNDVINVIDFFLQESSEFITGQNLYLGGVS